MFFGKNVVNFAFVRAVKEHTDKDHTTYDVPNCYWEEVPENTFPEGNS